MAITEAMCNSFKKELLEGVHNFKNSGGSTFKLALYTSSATLGHNTTAFTTTGQVSASGSYTSGGGTLTRVDPSVASSTSSATAFTDFVDLSFTTATITARGALIYNDSASGDPAVCVLNFTSDKTSTACTITIQFPTADHNSAIIRIA